MKLTEHPIHIGDGVYVKHDGYHVVLMANDHLNPTDTIYLEPSVLKTLIGLLEE